MIFIYIHYYQVVLVFCACVQFEEQLLLTQHVSASAERTSLKPNELFMSK